MSHNKKRALFFENICKFRLRLKEYNIEVIPTAFFRTPEQQAKLVAEGRSFNPNSKHLVWLAMDLLLIKDGKGYDKDCPEYRLMGKIWKNEFNGVWGGDWKRLNDIYHFEWKD